MRACLGLSFIVVAALCGCDDDGTSSGDAAASVRQGVQIDADQRSALLPDLEGVGGRVALTWAREDLMRRQHHMLSFLGCE